jgi:hypothetical protein
MYYSSADINEPTSCRVEDKTAKVWLA